MVRCLAILTSCIQITAYTIEHPLLQQAGEVSASRQKTVAAHARQQCWHATDTSCFCAVIRGRLDTTSLGAFGRLEFLNGAVQPVLASQDGTLIVGPARVAVPNLPARNGVVHIIDTVLSPDASVNSSGVALAEKMGDFGPFNSTKVTSSPSVSGNKRGSPADVIEEAPALQSFLLCVLCTLL